MRRLVILALLFGGMELLLPLGAPRHGGQRLLIFGFLILAADSVGELFAKFRMPRMVGYLATGLLFGPAALNVVTPDAVERLRPLSTLAIALIAFLAGAELRWYEVRLRAAAMTKIVTAEILLTFVALTALLYVLGARVSFLAGQPPLVVLSFSALFASIAIVHSPAVTMAVLTETRANGPVARTTLGVVLISDVFVVVLFSLMLAVTRVISPPSGFDVIAPSLLSIIWEVVGAVIVGAAIGTSVAAFLRYTKRELFLFSIVVAFAGATLTRLLHVETLLAMITAGFITQNFSRLEDGKSIHNAMERAAAPVFVVFFALAGARIRVADLLNVWTLVVPIVVIRMLAIWAGSRIGARWAGMGPEGRKVWLGLVSQAGVAIGLTYVVAAAYPARGAKIQTLLLAVIAVNEVVGAILFRHALVSSGEVPADDTPVALAPPATEPSR